MNENQIKVWDPLIRIFHWSLVIFFVTAFLTGEEEGSLHIYAGYAIIGLVLFRILWGFAGTEHARFRDFVFGPGKIVGYLKGMAQGKSERYVGHNPAGGIMVIVMLATLAVVTFTGLKVYAAEGHGPLAAGADYSIIATARAEESGEEEERGEMGGRGENGDEHFWEEIHEGASYFMLGLIALHLAGVAMSSRKHKENLVKAMITGNKDAEPK